MRKTGIVIAITALITSFITLAGSEYLHRKRSNIISPENNHIDFTSNPSKASSLAGNPDFIRAAAEVTPAVVHLKTLYQSERRSSSLLEELFGVPVPGGNLSGSGSGVLITTDGYIITNNHVVENASQIEVVLPDRRTFKGKVVGTDPTTDLALVKINGKNLPVVPLGNSDAVQVGEWVLAVGYPLSLSSTVTAGIISAKGRNIGILDRPARRSDPSSPSTAIESFIQTDAAINQGNSGGALVNTSGQLIGINAAIASQTGSYMGYGFAIPVNLAKKIVKDFREFGEVKRGYMGISFPAPAVEDQLLREQGINPGTVKGVYITQVQSGSAAASAGLKSGDIIQQIDGANVLSSAEFSERIARHRPGDKVTLTYLRNGKRNQVTATLKGQENLSGSAQSTQDELELKQRLGATFAPLDPAVKQRYRLRSGIIITGIQSGGFFHQVGIPEGTIITRVNGRPVNTVKEFNRLLGTSRNGVVRIEGITPDGASFVFNFPLGA